MKIYVLFCSQTEIRLIAKIPPKNGIRRQMYNSALHFTREKYAYGVVLEAFEIFQHKHLKANEIFCNYPKMYSSSAIYEDEYIVLSDLLNSGFRNCDKTMALNYEQCNLVLQNLAKFHAISFAYKDQHPELFSKITSDLTEILFNSPMQEQFDCLLKETAGYALGTLDPNKDSETFAKIQQFQMDIGQAMIDACACKADEIVLHGDCWISNMMFKKNVSILSLN